MGCITLVIACVLLVAGVRSIAIEDSWMILGDGPATMYSLISKDQEILWVRQDGIVFGRESEGFHSRKLTSRERDHKNYYDFEVGTNWLGFRYQRGERDLGRHSQGELLGTLSIVVRAIPYWSLVLPPALLSAYLLLWKPGKQTKAIPTFVGEPPNLEERILKHRAGFSRNP
ncbi:MAG: hypothetical protein JWP89_4906 [Schlesneria sp.]|nr:hypothetical protein [Schlesneria sp.]